MFSRRINIETPFSFSEFCDGLEEAINRFYTDEHTDIVIICIGTDRATGDCLGPLVGTKIRSMNYKNVHVFGTLDEPIHSGTLERCLNEIKRFDNPFVIAIDACLGRPENIDTICIQEGPLHPGSGVQKELPPVGTISIHGVVNIGGFMELIVLQNTRLSLVMNMANIIANGIKYVMWKLHKIGSENELMAELAATKKW
jgi:putative sporulation protein YyaC